MSELDDRELKQFNDGMETLLKANPQIVKAAMEQEKREREEARMAKKDGDRKKD